MNLFNSFDSNYNPGFTNNRLQMPIMRPDNTPRVNPNRNLGIFQDPTKREELRQRMQQPKIREVMPLMNNLFQGFNPQQNNLFNPQPMSNMMMNPRMMKSNYLFNRRF